MIGLSLRFPSKRGNMDLIKLKPILKSMIWGGTRLSERFGFDTPTDTTGEAWVVSAHHRGDCIIDNGPFAGLTLSELYKNHRGLFGSGKAQDFPLLIKFIDAKDDLSIQVHPDDVYARRVANSSGKTECWMVMECSPSSEIVIGHDFTDRFQFEEAMKSNTVQSHLLRFPIQPGDFFFIPAGTVHAICADTLIYEVQQNSDLTYRIDDYGRIDSTGNPRVLHKEQALEVTHYPHVAQTISPRTRVEGSLTITTYLDNEYFLIEKLVCSAPACYVIEADYGVIGCFSASAHINGCVLSRGEHALVLREARTLMIEGPCTLLISVPNSALR